MTAFELCGIYKGQHFKVKGGRVVWEHIVYRDNIDKCRVSRFVPARPGEENILGLATRISYIDPDITVEIIDDEL